MSPTIEGESHHGSYAATAFTSAHRGEVRLWVSAGQPPGAAVVSHNITPRDARRLAKQLKKAAKAAELAAL